jgi:putative flippase GtrA
VAAPDPSPPSIAHIWASDASLVERARRVVRHPSSLKLIKYASVSVISTVCSQLVLLLTFGVFRVMSEVPANILANAVATVPSYSLNRKWVWGKGGQSHFWREVVPFWVLSFVGLGFSSLAVWFAGDLSRDHHLSHVATSVMVNAANLASFAVLWIVKFLIYERLFHVDPVEFPADDGGDSDPNLVGA